MFRLNVSLQEALETTYDGRNVWSTPCFTTYLPWSPSACLWTAARSLSGSIGGKVLCSKTKGNAWILTHIHSPWEHRAFQLNYATMSLAGSARTIGFTPKPVFQRGQPAPSAFSLSVTQRSLNSPFSEGNIHPPYWKEKKENTSDVTIMHKNSN